MSRDTVIFDPRPPEVLSPYAEYQRRVAWLFEKYRVLLTTPKRREESKFDGYVPPPPYNSEGARIKGVKKDIHRAGIVTR